MVEKTINKTGINSNSVVFITTGILSLFIPLIGLLLGIFGIL